MAVDDLHPGAGARFLLEREPVSADGTSAHYRAAIYTPTERFDYLAELCLDGEHQLRAAGAAGDAAQVKRLDGFARQIARSAAGRRADGVDPWPMRVLRWRGPGRG